MQYNADDVERVVYYQSRQLQPAKRNYPVHEKDRLAMKYGLEKVRLYLLGDGPVIVNTDHATLRDRKQSTSLSTNGKKGVIFAEYNISVE